MPLTYRSATFEDLTSLVALLANDPLGSKREDASSPLNQAYVMLRLKRLIKTQTTNCWW